MTADGDRFARINRGLEGKLACPQIGRGFGESKRKSAEFQFSYSFGCMTIMSFISSEIPFAPVRLGELFAPWSPLSHCVYMPLAFPFYLPYSITTI